MNFSINKTKKIFFTLILSILTVVLLLIIEFSIQFYNEPLIKKYHTNTTGYIIYDIESGEKELVSIEIKGENLNYIFRNKENAIQGDIWLNGCSLFGIGQELDSVGFGFYTEFHSHSPDYAWVELRGGNGELCNMICLSKNWDRIVCGITINTTMGLETPLPSGTPALLVLSAESPDETIKEAVENSRQMREWILKNMGAVN